MRNQPSSSIKNTCLFKMYDIEHNYNRHKRQLSEIKSSDVKIKIKKEYKSQMNAATVLKKNWLLTYATRYMYRDQYIYEKNQILYKQIMDARRKESLKHKIMSYTNILNKPRMKTSNSVNQYNSSKIIQKYNEKLMERILTVKSPLSKDKMNESYQKIKYTKKLIQTYSSLNKSRIKYTLTKFNLKPQIYFPTIGTELKESNRSRSRRSRKSCSFSKMEPNENYFLRVNTYSQHQQSQNYWENSLILPRKKTSRIQFKNNHLKTQSSGKNNLNKTNFCV